MLTSQPFRGEVGRLQETEASPVDMALRTTMTCMTDIAHQHIEM